MTAWSSSNKCHVMVGWTMGSFSSRLTAHRARRAPRVRSAVHARGLRADALSGSRKKYREPTEKNEWAAGGIAPRSIGDEGGVHERSAEELAPAESCSVRSQ